MNDCPQNDIPDIPNTPQKRERLYRTIKFLAWGYVLLYLDVRILTVNILPNWLGFLLILCALPGLAEEVPSAKLLRPLAILLAAWDMMMMVSTPTSEIFSLLTVIITVAGLYFSFQLLTDLATLAETYHCPQTTSLLRLRTVSTLLATVLALPLPWQNTEWLTVLIVLIHLVIVIRLCVVLFGLKKALTPTNPEESE